MHAYMHTHAYSLTCAGGICTDTWFSASKLATRIHTLTAIIRSPYLKIRGNSENKASSKAQRGRETGREVWSGWVRWKRRVGHPTRGMGKEEGARGERGKEISDVL